MNALLGALKRPSPRQGSFRSSQSTFMQNGSCMHERAWTAPAAIYKPDRARQSFVPMSTIERVEEVVTRQTGLVLTNQEREAILEVSYLAIAADRKLREEEVAAFRAVAARLRDKVGDPQVGPYRKTISAEENRQLSARELNAILDKFANGLARSDADARLRELSKHLARPEARASAYRVAYALALCDLDASDAEFEFDLQLIDSLGLSQEEAEALADEVMQVFNGSEG